jgi:hypothetical protein
MKTQRERDAEKRAEKLREIDEAVEGGKLTIRQMTPEERKRFAPREPRPRRSR